MINYDLTKIRAIIFDVDGVLSCCTVSMSDCGKPQRTVNIRDGYAFQHAVKQGLTLGIITGGNDEAVRKRYEWFGLTDIHLECHMKLPVYEAFCEKYGLKDEEIIYMGDDIPDFEVMQRCGCPCCPSDAAPEIKSISRYISHIAGGQGCARDVIEQVLRTQGRWMSDKTAFGW